VFEQVHDSLDARLSLLLAFNGGERGSVIILFHTVDLDIDDFTVGPVNLFSQGVSEISDDLNACVFDPDMVTIDRAVRQAHCAFREIIRLLARGELKRVVRIDDALELSSLMVSLNEVRSKTALPDHGCIKLRDVELRSGTTTKTVQALLTLGHPPFKTETNPHNRCPQQVVHPSDLDNFIKTYVSLHSLAIEHSIPIANMR
jgi:hypothetical protein